MDNTSVGTENLRPRSCANVHPQEFIDTLLSSMTDIVNTLLPARAVKTPLSVLTVLCNSSFCDGDLPASQKRSILVPVLKAEGLDVTVPLNFRPIANVSFLSKINEKIVAAQLTHYLDINNLLPIYQSGFRKGHSTEILLVRLLSDIYGAIDRSEVTLLALFNVSAAFDTVDHQILLQRLFWSFWKYPGHSGLASLVPAGTFFHGGPWFH